MAIPSATTGLLSISSLVLMGTGAIAEPLPPSAAPHPSTIPIEQQVQEVVTRLVGVMDTADQARTDPQAPNVQMTTCTVHLWGDQGESSPSATFLYQEQALRDRLTQPYRQRFLRIAPSADTQSVESQGFRPLAPANWVGLCARSAAQRLVQASDLDTAYCSVFLQRVGPDYIGDTQAGGCPANYRGAVRITNHIILKPTGMETHDRGFDAQGNQVWGSTGNPYRFQRR